MVIHDTIIVPPLIEIVTGNDDRRRRYVVANTAFDVNVSLRLRIGVGVGAIERVLQEAERAALNAGVKVAAVLLGPRAALAREALQSGKSMGHAA